jgi:hypothetical protein
MDDDTEFRESLCSKNLRAQRMVVLIAEGEMVFNHFMNGDRIAHALISSVGELGCPPHRHPYVSLFSFKTQIHA